MVGCACRGQSVPVIPDDLFTQASARYTIMAPSWSSRKAPPGLVLVSSLLLNWRLVSLPVVLSGIFKPNIWQTILIFLATLPISVATVVCLRNLRYAKRLKELGAELPPLLPSKSLGGLDLLKALRWEYCFGYLGDCYLRCGSLATV